MLGIELINQCNFNCYFCAVSYVKEPLKQISLEEITNISKDIDELGISFIKLTPSRGEVFMHKQIYSILNVLTNINSVETIQFHTNFGLVDFDKLLNSNIDLDKLTIDVSHYGHLGVDEFTFQTNKDKKHYDMVEKNLKKATKLGIKHNLNVRTRKYNYDAPTQPRDVYKKQVGICHNFWVPRIMADGNFSYCTCSPDSSTIDERYIVGNIRETKFKELYLSPKRYEFFKQMKEGTNSACADCTSFTQSMYNPTVSVFKNFAKIKKLYNENV